MKEYALAHASQQIGSIPSYEVCLTLSGPMETNWQIGGHKFIKRLGPRKFSTSSRIESCLFSWDAPFDFVRLSIPPTLMTDLKGSREDGATVELLNQGGLRDHNIESILQMLRTNMTAGSPDSPQFCQQLGVALAVYMLERYIVSGPERSSTSNRLPGRVLQTVVAYIDERIAQPISIDELASHIRVSRFYFARLFRNSLGQTPGQYILDRRMEHAKRLLEKSDSNMQEVANASGFANQSHFASVFHRRNGVTPSHYRHMFR